MSDLFSPVEIGLQTIKIIKNGNLQTVFLPEECDIGALEFCGAVISTKPEVKDNKGEEASTD